MNTVLEQMLAQIFTACTYLDRYHLLYCLTNSYAFYYRYSSMKRESGIEVPKY